MDIPDHIKAIVKNLRTQAKDNLAMADFLESLSITPGNPVKGGEPAEEAEPTE